MRGLFHGTLSIPHNTVMDLNNVMKSYTHLDLIGVDVDFSNFKLQPHFNDTPTTCPLKVGKAFIFIQRSTLNLEFSVSPILFVLLNSNRKPPMQYYQH